MTVALVAGSSVHRGERSPTSPREGNMRKLIWIAMLVIVGACTAESTDTAPSPATRDVAAAETATQPPGDADPFAVIAAVDVPPGCDTPTAHICASGIVAATTTKTCGTLTCGDPCGKCLSATCPFTRRVMQSQETIVQYSDGGTEIGFSQRPVAWGGA